MKLYKKQLRPMIVNDGVQGCATTKTPLLPEHIWFDEEIVTDEDKLMWGKTIKDKDAYSSLSMECRYLEVEDTKKETDTRRRLLTPEEFKQEMIEIRDLDDETAKKKYGADWFSSTKDNHIYADNLMCQVLEKLGYDEGVEIFYEMYKWYD